MSISYIEETARGTQSFPVDALLLTERKVFIEGMIDENATSEFTRKMMYLSRNNGPVDIYISSQGGKIESGLAMYDIIQGFKNEINMYCIGSASSMAAVLLASGQKGRRFILPHSSVMIHEAILQGEISGSATSIRHLSESIIETRDLVNSILAKHTGKTLKEINSATLFNNFMNAKEAVEFGICDKIVNSVFEKEEV